MLDGLYPQMGAWERQGLEGAVYLTEGDTRFLCLTFNWLPGWPVVIGMN